MLQVSLEELSSHYCQPLLKSLFIIISFPHPLQIAEKNGEENHLNIVYNAYKPNLLALPIVFFTFWARYINNSSF